ncbi:MAG: hypothetical protein GY788_04640 [bacterium]|nr:hypothetical protein [bacterium]
MSADEVAMAFERFHKGSTSSGSGLGLTTRRDLVELHGGSVVIQSELGVGTSISVRMPKVIAA